MSITGYTDLRAAVSTWLARPDLASQIRDFITLAESDFQRGLRIRLLEKAADIIIDSEAAPLPSDFRAVRRFYVDTTPRRFLRYLSPEPFTDVSVPSVAGPPCYYTVLRDEFLFRPIPDAAYSGKLLYWRQLDALSSINETNDMLVAHPDLYLMGALLKGETYLQNDSRMQVWRSEYLRILEDIKAQDRLDRVAGSGLYQTGSAYRE